MTPTLTVDAAGQILTGAKMPKSCSAIRHWKLSVSPLKQSSLPHLRGPHSAGFQRFVKTGESRLPEIVTSPARHKSGAIVRLQISVKALHGAHGDHRRRSNDEALGACGSRAGHRVQLSAFARSVLASWRLRRGQLTMVASPAFTQLGRPARRKSLNGRRCGKLGVMAFRIDEPLATHGRSIPLGQSCRKVLVR